MEDEEQEKGEKVGAVGVKGGAGDREKPFETFWSSARHVRGGLVFEAHRLLYHLAQGSRTF